MDDIRPPLPDKPVRFLDQFRLFIRRDGLSYKTEKTYLYWARFYIHFHNKRHPKEMGAAEVEAFLNYLAEKRYVAPSTQRTALNALVCLYKRFLGMDIEEAAQAGED